MGDILAKIRKAGRPIKTGEAKPVVAKPKKAANAAKKAVKANVKTDTGTDKQP